jgi:hypothetical protein
LILGAKSLEVEGVGGFIKEYLETQTFVFPHADSLVASIIHLEIHFSEGISCTI